MKKRLRVFALGATVALLAGLATVPVQAGHNDDDHSKNFVQRVRKPIKIEKDLLAQGSDLAFKGRLVIAGSYQGLAIFKTLKRKPFLKQISFFQCPGGQGDVSVYRDYVFFSVDSTLVGEKCNAEDTATAPASQYGADAHWEGLRIFDISDPKNIEYVKGIKTACGSHTNTLLPGEDKSYIYIESYPLSGQSVGGCNYAIHRKTQIIEFPNDDPTKAKLLEQTVDTSPAPGCHDITTFPEKELMFGACINQSMIWSIKDPTAPELLSVIENPNIQIHHSTAMTWDAKILILGDEYAGAAGGGGCTGDEDATVGAAWFYDVTDPTNPTLLGHHSLPRVPEHADSADEAERFRCTNHNFNVIPMKDPKKYLLAVSYYMGGIAVVDFSDATDPTEVAHYVHTPGGVPQDTWAAYWYQGRIYTNDYLSLHGVGSYFFKGSGKKKAYFFKSTPFNPEAEMNPQVQIFASLRK